MAYFIDLRGGCDAMGLTNGVALALRCFSHHHRYTRGTELRQTTQLICQEVAHAALCALSGLPRSGAYGVKAPKMSEQAAEQAPIGSIRHAEPQRSICWHAMR